MHIHFIGIGGIGTSALARYYLTQGDQISGSDLVSSEITDALKKLGAKIFIGQHKARYLTPDVKQVIYSPAVRQDNPELKIAKKRKIKTLNYPEALGELTKRYFTIAVSGTHGKSTTTAMIGLILIKAGLDPTVVVGTKVPQFGKSNCRVGESQYLVIEADEHFASFLNYWPKIIVLTNIEREHLDFYKNLKNILKTYKKYLLHLPEDGILVTNKDDLNIKKISGIIKNVKYYSLKQKEAKKLKKILKIPGEHNVSNALAALTVARLLKIPDKISLKTLSEYKGSWRRFEIKHTNLPRSELQSHKSTPITVVSDYGHHPTEIRATLKAAREKYPQKKIWCVYQPHQYQRTYYLFKDFVKVFREVPVDKLIITDIYDVAGREEKKIKEKVDSEKLVQTINKRNVIYLPKAKIINFLRKNLRGGLFASSRQARQASPAATLRLARRPREVVIIIMGAGDIYNLFLFLTEKKEKRK